jgi:hypothetical protein
MSRPARLTLIALGAGSAESAAALEARFAATRTVELPFPAHARLESAASDLNRAIDEAAADWVLVLRAGEIVTPALAEELGAAVERQRAWGFRLRAETHCCGSILRDRDEEGDVRLFHTRHARFTPGGRDPKVQGSVVRLCSPLVVRRFATTAEHQAFLSENGVPHSTLRRILIFMHRLFAERLLFRGANAVRHAWMEAGFDRVSPAVVFGELTRADAERSGAAAESR